MSSRRPVVLSWVLFVVDSFMRNRCFLLASSLCYTTVLSLVPLLAVAFSLAKGFGIYDAPFLRDVLLRLMAEKTDVVDAILGYIQNTNVKALGVIGVATLFVTASGLLATMEDALDIVWRATSRRPVWNRFANFVTVVLVCPLFILAAFSVTATLQNAQAVQWLREIALVNSALSLMVSATPMLMVTASLFVLYKFLPNAPVRSLPALIGALVAGLAWQATQAAYIRWQIGVTGYNAIYGSFAQIPLLLVWLYISWVIVLAGAQIANAVQNYSRQARQDDAARASHAHRRDVALLCAILMAGRMDEGRPPLDPASATVDLGVPESLAAQELARLARRGVALRVHAPAGEERYVLAAPPDKISVGEVIAAWEGLGRDTAGMPQEAELNESFPLLEDIRAGLSDTLATAAPMTLREAWARLQQAGEGPDPAA